ncbi:hypothetical protein EVA_12951 [gut metagenome]|uniref:Uncharacterized protein n=1 Tax=gut metagenome TaxID=749906 RepID=J9FVB4_9ZZZZ
MRPSSSTLPSFLNGVTSAVPRPLKGLNLFIVKQIVVFAGQN